MVAAVDLLIDRQGLVVHVERFGVLSLLFVDHSDVHVCASQDRGGPGLGL